MPRELKDARLYDIFVVVSKGGPRIAPALLIPTFVMGVDDKGFNYEDPIHKRKRGRYYFDKPDETGFLIAREDLEQVHRFVPGLNLGDVVVMTTPILT